MRRREPSWSNRADDDDGDSPSLPTTRLSGVRPRNPAVTLLALSTTRTSTFLMVGGEGGEEGISSGADCRGLCIETKFDRRINEMTIGLLLLMRTGFF